MEQLMKKLDEQNITVADYGVMVKVIQASLHRGSIRGEECSTVGRLYDKLIFQINKMNKENENAGLSKTDN